MRLRNIVYRKDWVLTKDMVKHVIKRKIERIANLDGKFIYDVISCDEQISGFLHIVVKSIGKS